MGSRNGARKCRKQFDLETSLFHLIPLCHLVDRTKIHEVKLAFKSFHFNKHHAGPCDLYVNMHG
jgi:hypothetical protein